MTTRYWVAWEWPQNKSATLQDVSDLYAQGKAFIFDVTEEGDETYKSNRRLDRLAELQNAAAKDGFRVTYWSVDNIKKVPGFALMLEQYGAWKRSLAS